MPCPFFTLEDFCQKAQDEETMAILFVSLGRNAKCEGWHEILNILYIHPPIIELID